MHVCVHVLFVFGHTSVGGEASGVKVIFDRLSVKQELTNMASSACQLALGVPCLCSLKLGLQEGHHTRPTLAWVLGIMNPQSLHLQGKLFKLRAIPPTQVLVFLTWSLVQKSVIFISPSGVFLSGLKRLSG